MSSTCRCCRSPCPGRRCRSTPSRRTADLYGLPLEEFTGARNALARELRKEGKKEAADEVGQLRKPTRSVWAANQVARRRPQEVRLLVEAGEELRKAQRAAVSGRDPQALREAQSTHRALLDELAETAREVLRGASPTLTQALQTLRAASSDKEASKALLQGALVADVEQSGFGPLLSAVPRSSARKTVKPKPKPDPRIARRAKVQEQLAKARERVRELETRLDELGA